MNIESNPARFVDSDDLVALLEEAGLSDFDNERAQRNAAVIRRKIVALTALGLAPAGVKAAITASTIVKIALPVLVVTGLGVTAAVFRPARPTQPSVVVSPPLESQEATSRDATSREATIREDARIFQPATKVTPKRESTLQEQAPKEDPWAWQLQTFDAATQLAKQNEHEQALALLYELDRRHPDSPLQVEVIQAQAENLFVLNRDDDALTLVERLLDDPRVTGKRAQLFRLQGDILQRQGRCDQAAPAYLRALGMGLNATDADAARAGLKKCASR